MTPADVEELTAGRGDRSPERSPPYPFPHAPHGVLLWGSPVAGAVIDAVAAWGRARIVRFPTYFSTDEPAPGRMDWCDVDAVAVLRRAGVRFTYVRPM